MNFQLHIECVVNYTEERRTATSSKGSVVCCVTDMLGPLVPDDVCSCFQKEQKR
jgi:hypothetical protein